MKINKSEFGDRLRKFRIQHSLSQTELADILGTTQGNIGHIENGRRKPGPDVLLNLYVHFQSDFRYLLLGNQISEKISTPDDHPTRPEPHLSPVPYPDEYIKSHLQKILRETKQALDHMHDTSSQL